MEYYTEKQITEYGEKMYQYGKIIAEADIGYVPYPKTKPALPQAHVVRTVCDSCGYETDGTDTNGGEIICERCRKQQTCT